MQTSILKLFILGLGGKIKMPGCSGLFVCQQIQAFSRAFAEAVQVPDLLKHVRQIQASSRAFGWRFPSDGDGQQSAQHRTVHFSAAALRGVSK